MKKAASKRFKIYQWFDSDEGSFYKHVTNNYCESHGWKYQTQVQKQR